MPKNRILLNCEGFNNLLIIVICCLPRPALRDLLSFTKKIWCFFPFLPFLYRPQPSVFRCLSSVLLHIKSAKRKETVTVTVTISWIAYFIGLTFAVAFGYDQEQVYLLAQWS